MKKTTQTLQRKLQVVKTKVRDLDNGDLRNVNGGMCNGCTGGYTNTPTRTEDAEY